MRFTLNGTDYRLAFRYPVAQKQRKIPTGIPGRQLIQTDTYRSAEAVLYTKADGPRPNGPEDATYHWLPFKADRSDCSLKDRWNRKRGREIALGRLLLSVPAELAQAAREAYLGR